MEHDHIENLIKQNHRELYRQLSSPFQFTSKNELLCVTLIMDFAEVRLNHRITLVMLTLVLHHDIHNFMIQQNPLIR